MSDIEQKALALLRECVGNAVWKHPITRINRQGNLLDEALCRAIEQHEAFRQEVSDRVKLITSTTIDDGVWRVRASDLLSKFILPEPTPDPLVAVLGDLEWNNNSPECAAELRAALDARGLKIVEVKNDD